MNILDPKRTPTFGPKRTPAEFAALSEAKRGILNDIRTRWGKFSEDELRTLVSNDDLVSEIASRYKLPKAQAQTDVDAVMQGRQI